jgi:hypothetical protein
MSTAWIYVCLQVFTHSIMYKVDTCNVANHNEDLNLHISANDRDNVPDYSDNSGVERKIDRDTALRKLMGTNNVYNPDKISTPVRATEPTSLAAFIGGRASGPRLNRHAPQQDAHDPTQFVQPDTSRPHPVFGRGGIAMPGMADKKGSNAYGSYAGSESSERYRPSLTAKPKSPSPPTLNASSKIETSNRSSVDISRLSLTSPSKVAERYIAKVEDSPVHLGTEIPQSNLPSFRTRPSKVAERSTAKVEDSPVHLGTEIPQSNLPSFRTTKSTFSAPSSPFTKKDTGQEQESYLRNSNSSNKLANRSLSNVPNLTSALPQVSVSSSPGPLKFGSSNKSDNSISTINASPLVGAQSSVKPLAIRTKSAERTRDTPLRKLMEINNIHNPDAIAAHASQKSEASSLAAFIGGRATGPRLNRHAPQQDVHDPTQFVQPDLSAPHPVFGKGGIAMPGMMTKPVESSFSIASMSTTPSAQSRGENTGNRTTSGSSSKELEGFASVDRNPSPTKGFGATTRDRTISTPSYSRSIGTSYELSRSSVSPTPRLSNSTLGLAQPIRPDIKASSIVPQIPSTYMPSPAFQKPLSQKDPTPSISRLQGRGFVQSMVKVSAEISSPTTPSPSKSRPASGRKNTVLDRWPPNMQADTSPTRPTSSHPDVMRRSTTFNTMSTISDDLNYVSTHATGSSRSLKPVASLPSLINAATPREIDPPVDESLVPEKPSGLGSASTMVVLKPSKSSGNLGQIPWHEELGMKHNPTNISRQGSPFSPRSEKATSSRKSLNYVR